MKSRKSWSPRSQDSTPKMPPQDPMSKAEGHKHLPHIPFYVRLKIPKELAIPSGFNNCHSLPVSTASFFIPLSDLLKVRHSLEQARKGSNLKCSTVFPSHKPSRLSFSVRAQQKWLPQIRVARRKRAILPSTRW